MKSGCWRAGARLAAAGLLVAPIGALAQAQVQGAAGASARHDERESALAGGRAGGRVSQETGEPQAGRGAQAAADPHQMAPAPIAPGAPVILVTSSRDRAGPLRDYAGSAAVFDAQALEARQFRDLSTLSYAAPNVSLDPIGTFRGVANFAIRGLGINSSIPSIDPAVGLFVDGVYMGINAGTVLDALDVRQVEILRGPQGVAFGRNTTGGAVMMQTADPAEEWEAQARIGYESPVDSGRGIGMFTARSVISGPIAEGLSFRIGALIADDGGHFRNLADGQPFGAAQTAVLRAGLAYRHGTFSLIGKVEHTRSRGDGAAGHNSGLFGRGNFNLSLNQPGFHDNESQFATLRAEVDLGPGRLANIFGWRQFSLFTRNDIDSTPQPIFESDTGTTQHQWSNELVYTAEAGPMRLVAGAYVFSQQIAYEESRDLSFFGAPAQFGGGRQDHQTYGLFSQIEYQLAPAFELKAGLRLTHEEKSARITYIRARAACSVIAASCPLLGERVPGEANGFADSRSWTNLAPRLVASWQALEDARVYASWSRGFRSGGYNLRITQPAAFQQVAEQLGSPAFDEEQVDTFELGAKWQSAGGLLLVQGALFWTEVGNMQRELNVPSASAGLAQSVFNTADARIRGAELEAWLNPSPRLSLAANVGWLDAGYRRVFLDLSGDGAVNGADLGLALPRAPAWTFGASGGYEIPIGNARFVRADLFYQFRDRFAYTDNNWGFNDLAHRLDGSVTLGCETCGARLTLFGRNLLDQVQFGGDTHLGFAAGPFSDGVNSPFDPRPGAGTFSPMLPGRSVGLELAVQF